MGRPGGDDLYVRSWRGSAGGSYRGARDSHEGRISAGGVDRDVAFVDADEDVGDAVDAAYREKYGRYSGYVGPVVRSEARATTIKLVPHSDPAYGLDVWPLAGWVGPYLAGDWVRLGDGTSPCDERGQEER